MSFLKTAILIPALISVSLSITAPKNIKKKYTVLLDPAGDAQHTGRSIEQQYERTVTFQLAQAIKKDLEKTSSDLLVLFTRLPGEQAHQLEKASLANQLMIDLYISLSCYQTNRLKPQIHLYYYSTGQQTSATMEPLHCIPLHKAHMAQEQKTKQIGEYMQTVIANTPLQRYCDVHRPIGFPCKPCKGITAPHLCLELGLKHQNDLVEITDLLTQVVRQLCVYIKDY